MGILDPTPLPTTEKFPWGYDQANDLLKTSGVYANAKGLILRNSRTAADASFAAGAFYDEHTANSSSEIVVPAGKTGFVVQFYASSTGRLKFNLRRIPSGGSSTDTGVTIEIPTGGGTVQLHWPFGFGQQFAAGDAVSMQIFSRDAAAQSYNFDVAALVM